MQMRAILTGILLLSILFKTMAKEKVLVLFYSDHGGTYELAREVAKGIESGGVQAVIKQVSPKIKGVPVATVEELPLYDGIAFGSPVYFGNISTGMSEFLSHTLALWSAHALEGMPATVFMSAGSGAGRELAIQSFWSSLASHGMILVPTGIKGHAWQGQHFAKVAKALKGTWGMDTLPVKQLALPPAPKPVGNYQPFVRTGNLVFINQVALKDGKILYPGKAGADISDEQAKEATRTAMLNVIAVLNEAVGGDLHRVKRCVQLTGIFNTTHDYTKHADLMNAASNLAVEVFGEKGKHARATLGSNALPLHASVEIQAVFEVE